MVHLLLTSTVIVVQNYKKNPVFKEPKLAHNAGKFNINEFLVFHINIPFLFQSPGPGQAKPKPGKSRCL